MSKKKNAGRGLRQRKVFRFFIAITLISLLALVLLLSPLFSVREIVVQGNNVISNDLILLTADLSVGQNILSFNASERQRRISSLPYVSYVAIARDFPDTVIISITERIPIAFIRIGNSNNLLLIDDKGMVLEILSSGIRNRDLPIFIGFEVDSFSIGEYLKLDNTAVFIDILLLSRAFRRHSFSPDSVDVSNTQDIIVNSNNWEIYIGTTEDADVKVQLIQEIRNQHGVYDRARLFVRDISSNPVLRPLN